jgi:Holliday junction resolvase RusA-like endonuclease
MEYEFLVNPIGKPRMTQRDKWLNPPRPEVLRYRLAKEAVCFFSQATNFQCTPVLDITFVVSMSESWSKKKKALHDGQPHQQKPDIDNLLKFLLDTLLPNGDEFVHEVKLRKVWGYEGKIIINTSDEIKEGEQ